MKENIHIKLFHCTNLIDLAMKDPPCIFAELIHSIIKFN